MSQAVLVTLLCFPFTGTMAIVYASQVSSKLQAGDVDGAKTASLKARRMVWLSVLLGFVMIALTVIGGLALALYLAAKFENP
jgi:Na+-driven multidrug efflux pump